MNKFSSAEVGQVLKLAAENLREISAENQDLKTKVAQYEKRDVAEKIANSMEEKGIEAHLSHQEKIAGLLKRDDLRVVEEAVGFAAPQMKIASVYDDSRVGEDGEGVEGAAVDAFAQSLASLG